jgi:hypothetical protein
LDAEEGNVVGVRQAHAPNAAGSCRSRITGDTSFTRSKGPCTSIVTSLPRRKSQEVARSRWYRGRANPRKREEPAPGSSRTGVARLAACLPLPQGRQRGTSEKEGGCGLRPCEETRAPVGLLVRRMQLQKSPSGAWPRITSGTELQKEPLLERTGA